TELQTPMIKERLLTYVQDAMKNLAGSKTRQGQALLAVIVLLDEQGRLNNDQAGLSRWVITKLDENDQGQSINKSVIIEDVYTVQDTEDIQITKAYKMEPELFTVILAALVKNGDIFVTINGKAYDAMNFEELIKVPQADFSYFSHIKKQSGLPMPAIRAMFQLFDIEDALLREQALDLGIVQLINNSRAILEESVKMMNDVRDGFLIGESKLLTDSEINDNR